MSAVPEGITSADVIVWGEGGTFAQQIAAGRHRLKGDEPDSVGGTDTGPSPYDFLLAALGLGLVGYQATQPAKVVTIAASVPPPPLTLDVLVAAHGLPAGTLMLAQLSSPVNTLA